MKKIYHPIPLEDVALFCKKHYIEKMSLFGSVLTPQFGPKSDVDFLVKFNKNHIPSLFDVVDMQEELCQIVGRPIDLVTEKSLSHFFREEVLNQALNIYEKP